jgi:hypothetical protein
VRNPLEMYFEEYVEFRLEDRTPIAGSVFIGATEFDPVEVLRRDPVAYRSEFQGWQDEVWEPEQRERRDLILAMHGNVRRYADLRACLMRGQVVPFIGSGMSAASGLPLWSSLLRRIREYAGVSKRGLEALLKAYKFEEAAAFLANGTNVRLFDERIEHELSRDEQVDVQGALRLLPALFSGVAITTNLDRLLELHYARCERSFAAVLDGQRVADFRRVREEGKRYLLKLHGDCTRASGRVLLPSEYDAAYAPGSTIREELALLYRNNSLLFLGCSLGADRTIQLVAEVAGSDPNMPKHYTFLQCPPTERKRVERENWLTKRGIYPIWYPDDHDGAITCLLAGLIDPQNSRATNGSAR